MERIPLQGKSIFTGPIEHDPLMIFVILPILLLVLWIIWKVGKYNWPSL